MFWDYNTSDPPNSKVLKWLVLGYLLSTAMLASGSLLWKGNITLRLVSKSANNTKSAFEKHSNEKKCQCQISKTFVVGLPIKKSVDMAIDHCHCCTCISYIYRPSLEYGFI